MRVALTAWLVAFYLAPVAAGASPCAAPSSVWGNFPPLAHVAAELRRDHHLTIVALGSSSTLGVGASSQATSYPAQLERLLEQRFPGSAVDVVNRGIGGDTVAANLARFDRDVLPLRSDLVIWQVGTNDALIGVPSPTLRRQVLEGVARLRGSGAEVVLMDPQPLPQADREREVQRVRDVLADISHTTGIPLLPRHELMRHWQATGQFKKGSLLGPDGLHMTDTSYRCLAERIADLFPANSEEPSARAS